MDVEGEEIQTKGIDNIFNRIRTLSTQNSRRNSESSKRKKKLHTKEKH
jgi:hypothetical protein